MKRRTALKTIGIGMGVTVSASTLLGVLSSCQSESAAGWVPSFLSSAQSDLINEMADIILPATDTPGAKDANIMPFIDALIGKVYKPTDQAKLMDSMSGFISGLASYNKDEDGNISFDIDREELSGILQDRLGTQSDDSWKARKDLMWGERPTEAAKAQDYDSQKFVDAVRSLAINGYFHSELIGTEHLNYDPVPGELTGCIPLADVPNGRLWSLS